MSACVARAILRHPASLNAACSAQDQLPLTRFRVQFPSLAKLQCSPHSIHKSNVMVHISQKKHPELFELCFLSVGRGPIARFSEVLRFSVNLHPSRTAVSVLERTVFSLVFSDWGGVNATQTRVFLLKMTFQYIYDARVVNVQLIIPLVQISYVL